MRLLSAALGSGHSRPMTIYTMAMILNPGTSTQLTPVTNEIKVGSIIDVLFSDPGDPEKAAAEEDAADIRIHSTLILLKLSPAVELDVGRVKGLIVQMEEAIGDPSVRDPKVAKSSEADIGADRATGGRRSISRRCFSSLCPPTRARSISKDFGRGYGRCWRVESYRSWVTTTVASSRWAWMCRSLRLLQLIDRDRQIPSSRRGSMDSPCSNHWGR